MTRPRKPTVTVSPVREDARCRTSARWTFTILGDGQACSPHFYREDQAKAARRTFVKLAREQGRRVITAPRA